MATDFFTRDDDILELAARQAKLCGVSLSKTVSDLLREGLNASTPAENKDGLLTSTGRRAHPK